MSNADGSTPGPPALSDWEVDRLADHLDRLLEELLSRGDEEVAAAVVGLVEGIERIHAEGMRRLAELLARSSDLFARAERDPVISSLFAAYDLSVQAPAGAGGDDPALEPAGASPTGDTSVVPRATLVRLRRRLEGRAAEESGPGAGVVVPPGDPDAAEATRASVGTFPLSDLAEPGLYGLTVGRASVLVVRDREGGVHAFRNACPGSPLPLHLGTLYDAALVCPWHGCRFDPSSGERLDREGPSLRRFAVRELEGTLRIAVP